MTKADLIVTLAKKNKVSQAKAGEFLDSALAEIKDLLSRGDSISFTGFGSFSVSARDERRGRNPQTGKEITIPATKVVRFRMGKALKEAVSSK